MRLLAMTSPTLALDYSFFCETSWLISYTLYLIHTRRDVWLHLMDIFMGEKKQNIHTCPPRNAYHSTLQTGVFKKR